MNYLSYNREERAICAHLFRLLHEKLATDPQNGALFEILKFIASSQPNFFGKGKPLENIDSLNFSSATVYTEVALIRDAYQARKPNIESFMNELVETVKRQEGIINCRMFSELPEELRNPSKTHPKQIRQKVDSKQIDLSIEEKKVYGAVQAMFNAKPDLAIAIDDYLIVFEAKFTGKFDEEQLIRTRNIAEIWTSELLFRDMGFINQPTFTVVKLGDSSMDVNLSWTQVLEVAHKYYEKNDRSLVVFEKGVELLNRMFRLP